MSLLNPRQADKKSLRSTKRFSNFPIYTEGESSDWLIGLIATVKIGGRASSWVLGLLLSGVSWSFDGGGSSSSKGKVLVFDLQKCRRKMKRNKTKESRQVREMILGKLEQRSNILEQK